MNRRSFISRASAFVFGCALAVRAEVSKLVPESVYDPNDYMGELGWQRYELHNGKWVRVPLNKELPPCLPTNKGWVTIEFDDNNVHSAILWNDGNKPKLPT